MGDEEMAVGDYLQTVGVVHGVIRDQQNFRSDEDKEHSEAKRDPQKDFESGTGGTGREQGGRCHYSPVSWIDGKGMGRGRGRFGHETRCKPFDVLSRE